jgi:hypothetical protein
MENVVAAVRDKIAWSKLRSAICTTQGAHFGLIAQHDKRGEQLCCRTLEKLEWSTIYGRV